jgi:hypothetical protein
LGLTALIGRAEFVHQTRPRWRFAVQGYDPRDILRGRYLNLQYDFNRAGPDTCAEWDAYGDPPQPEAWPPYNPQCCLCLTRTNPEGINPQVRAVSCEEAPRCDGWMRTEDVHPPVQFFIPEERAYELEQALRDHDAALEVVIDPNGHPSLTELYLDGIPWRERLE